MRYMCGTGTCEPVGVDADGEGRHPRQAAIVLHARRRALQPQDARARGHKVAGVVVSVEADEVGLEDCGKEESAARKGGVRWW